jgi:hypothetical protein
MAGNWKRWRRGDGDRYLVAYHQHQHDQGGGDAAKGHGGGHVHAGIEGQAGGDMVAAHHERDQQKRQKSGQAQGFRGHPAILVDTP